MSAQIIKKLKMWYGEDAGGSPGVPPAWLPPHTAPTVLPGQFRTLYFS